jgi:hypothetical protein
MDNQETQATLGTQDSEFESCSWRDVLDTTIYKNVCQWLVTDRWFSPGTPVSSTNKTDHHDIAEILWKMALSTITLSQYVTSHWQTFLYIVVSSTSRHEQDSNSQR